MKVAATQFAPVFKDGAKNLETAITLVKAAASHGAQLVVLPELCFSGYSLMSTEEARPFSEVLTGVPSLHKDVQRWGPVSSLTTMKGLASALGIAIAWGLIEEDPGSGDLYNTQVLVLPTGEWTSYRKVNSWGNDYLWSKPGKGSPPIIKYLGKDVGLLICADVRDSSDKIESFYEAGDANIVAFSANWGDGGFPAGRWVKFAQGNRCTLIVSNRYGREANNNFGEGGICVIEPSGKVHCEGLKWNQPCIVYADVP